MATLEHTKVELRAHPPTDCEGRPCPLHNRTRHALRSFPQHWRSDRGLMERICPLGVGHPDPDQWHYLVATHGVRAAKAEFVHGCVANPYSGTGMCTPWLVDDVPAALLYPHPGHAVSLEGHVWSWWYPTSWNSENRTPYEIRADLPPHLLKPKMVDGQLRVKLRRADGSSVRAQVPRLVWLGWQGELSKRSKVEHINSDPTDNDIRNLFSAHAAPVMV